MAQGSGSGERVDKRAFAECAGGGGASRTSSSAAEPRRPLHLWLDRFVPRRRRRRGQNLPFYPHFSSEEDHRRALEACRCRRRAAPESAARQALQRAARIRRGARILPRRPAEDSRHGQHSARKRSSSILHAMFLADAAMLPEGFASRLKSVIANQFALNAFYDLVQRHNEAVTAGNWTQPFPLDAAKDFFGAVGDNTPRWFVP